jgi:hypothetical protein
MTVATYLSAECKRVGRLKQGQYGDYHPCLFESDSGTEFWKSYKPGDQELQLLTQGETYSFVALPGKNGKPDYKLVAPPAATTQPPTEQEHKPDSDRRGEILRYASSLADLYGACWELSRDRLSSLGASQEESVRACASSLFIATTRTFSM